MIEKVISGGQVGADLGGLAAAHSLSIQTGGWVPKGFKTKYGARPELSKLGLIEHTSDQYAPRTFANVKDSDGTIRLAYDFNSRGELLTLKAIDSYKKPHFDIDLNDKEFVFFVTDWIKDNNIKILNIAGNAGSTRVESNRIFIEVRDYLTNVLRVFTPKETERNAN